MKEHVHNFFKGKNKKRNLLVLIISFAAVLAAACLLGFSVWNNAQPRVKSTDVSDIIPKSFKSQKITQTVEDYSYSIYVPAEWIFDKNSGDLYTDKEQTRVTGGFVCHNYDNSQPIENELGNHFYKLFEDKNLNIINNQTVEILGKRENSLEDRKAGDNSMTYELHYFVISKDKTTYIEITFYSNKINEAISDKDKDAVLKTIYDNTGLDEEKINEILQSYEETKTKN